MENVIKTPLNAGPIEQRNILTFSFLTSSLPKVQLLLDLNCHRIEINRYFNNLELYVQKIVELCKFYHRHPIAMLEIKRTIIDYFLGFI